MPSHQVDSFEKNQRYENHNPTEMLWYDRPAERWIEALPIGNGRFGAMVHGGVNKDVLQLNEETIWEGHYSDKNNHKASQALPLMRDLIFRGEIQKAADLARETMISIPRFFGHYQPLGDLTIEVIEPSEFSGYRRQLDIGNAIASVDYMVGKGTYRKEYFASAIDQVIAVRYTSDQPGSLNLAVTFTREREAVTHKHSEDMLELQGQLGEKGVQFYSVVRIKSDGGTVHFNPHARPEKNTIAYVDNANSVTFFIAANSDYYSLQPITNNTQLGGADYKEKCLNTVNAAYEKGFDQIKGDHIREYRSLYNRFSIELSDNKEQAEDYFNQTTYDWLEQVRSGKISPAFATLYINYCRYLLISSSRPGCLPSNLQGIWNEQYMPFCESDYHTNINVQMNYWPADAYNLSDCSLPLFDWMESLVIPGSYTAKVHYNAEGWVVHHCSDIWGYTPPNNDIVGIWPMGAAWLSRHMYEYYVYNQDEKFLKERAYPVIKGAVQFLLDFLVEAPEGTAYPGYLVTNPSHSPENQFIMEDGTVGMFTYGATMDIEIIHDIFTICLELIDIQSKDQERFDEAFKTKILSTLKRLPPVKVSERTGGVQEWAEDYKEQHIGHRHVSQLYGVYPGRMITPEKTPELAQAAKRTILRKYENGYDGQGWSLSWLGAIWARLGEPQRAYEAIQEIFQRHILFNLMINAHGYVQVGDAQGIPAAILEMLAQSHDEKILILPALPDAWPNGKVSGMKLRGGYLLNMNWKDHQLTKATLKVPQHESGRQIEIGCKGDYHIEKVNDSIIVTLK